MLVFVNHVIESSQSVHGIYVDYSAIREYIHRGTINRHYQGIVQI